MRTLDPVIAGCPRGMRVAVLARDPEDAVVDLDRDVVTLEAGQVGGDDEVLAPSSTRSIAGRQRRALSWPPPLPAPKNDLSECIAGYMLECQG